MQAWTDRGEREHVDLGKTGDPGNRLRALPSGGFSTWFVGAAIDRAGHSHPLIRT